MLKGIAFANLSSLDDTVFSGGADIKDLERCPEVSLGRLHSPTLFESLLSGDRQFLNEEFLLIVQSQAPHSEWWDWIAKGGTFHPKRVAG